MKYGLIGAKLSHSFSKEIHNRLFDYDYELLELSVEELKDFFEKRDFIGINVTVPYKETVMQYLDDISIEAQQIGAVNTIINKDGKLYGYNTDFFGLKRLLCKNNISIEGKNVAVLGTGGTSKTANAVCKSLNAGEIITVSRSMKTGCITYSELYNRQERIDVIINTTPCGMFPDIDGCPVGVSQFSRLNAVADAVYNPLKTEFVLSAEEKDITAVNGLYMLVAQAAYAAELFTGESCSQKIEEVYSKILFSKKNVVLIGMPGCGKTTVGKKIAKNIGFNFIDTDKLIVDREKISIPEIFERYGEVYFREREKEVIKEICTHSGAVIATGGGAVLNPENIRNLKRNGVVVFLDRPLEKITALKGRPLSADREMLRKRYEERYPIYTSSADVKVSASDGVSENAEVIVREIMNYLEV